MLETKYTISPQTQHIMDVPVVVDGLTLSISDTQVRFFGVDYMLAASTWTAPTSPHRQNVTGYVVRDTTTNKLELFIDLLVEDGVDKPYIFQPGDRYTVMAHLFIMVMMPNGTDLVATFAQRYVIADKFPEEQP